MKPRHTTKFTVISLRVFFSAIALIMVYAVGIAASKSNLMTLRIDEPWFITTLVDFYLLIAILSAWVIYKERTWGARVGWILSFVCLGSIATALYVVVQLFKIKPGDSLDQVVLHSEAERS